MQADDFDVILFDLGGVLVELIGVAQMMAWAKYLPSIEDMWHKWLNSQVVRDFESGLSDPEQFAAEMITEFDLPVSAATFLHEFRKWPRGVYPGTRRLLRCLSRSYRLALLSNTNAVHWQRVIDEMAILDLFEASFPSHQTGLLKPDRDAFYNVARQLDTPPQRILFLDDNRINTEGAQSVGMAAHTVAGLDGVQAVLSELKLIGADWTADRCLPD